MKKSIKCEARTPPQQLFQSVELSHEKKMALSILFNHIDHDIPRSLLLTNYMLQCYIIYFSPGHHFKNHGRVNSPYHLSALSDTQVKRILLHAHQHLRITNFTKQAVLNVQSQAFRVLASKSGLGYQLVSKTYPKPLLKNSSDQNQF